MKNALFKQLPARRATMVLIDKRSARCCASWLRMEDTMYKKMLLAPVMAIACVLTLVLAGCGGASAEDLIRENIESYMGEIDGANEEFVAGLEASAGEDLEQLGLSADEFAAAYLDGYGYEIGDITVDGETATAEITITIKSYSDIMTTFQNDFYEWAYSVDVSSVTQDDIYQQAGQMLLDATTNAEPVSTTVEVGYTQNSDGDWEMDSSSQTELSSVVMA